MATARITQIARKLRTAMTDAERSLWQHLRRGQMEHCKFRRQYPIAGYVVDFICLEARLIIEVDGGQHAEQTRQDLIRDQALACRGYRVLRYWNNQVLGEMEAVLDSILNALQEQKDLPLPVSPTGVGEE